MARKFLYVIAALIMLTVAGKIAYNFFGAQMMRMAFVPTGAFEDMSRLPGSAYGDAKMWITRPDKPRNAALWTPAGYAPAVVPEAAVFFIHPTSYLVRAKWNALRPSLDYDAIFAAALQGRLVVLAYGFNDTAQKTGVLPAPPFIDVPSEAGRGHELDALVEFFIVAQ